MKERILKYLQNQRQVAIDLFANKSDVLLIEALIEGITKLPNEEYDMSSSELDDYITAKYEPLKQDFKALWATAKDENGYILFENWWSDYLKVKFEEADEIRKKAIAKQQ